MKKKLTLGLFACALSTIALLSSAPPAESQQACTLFCIQGYHCCVSHAGKQSCIPLSEECKG
jgi:hypothetical protein